MSRKIIQLNEGAIKDELKELVRGSVEVKQKWPNIPLIPANSTVLET